MQKVIMTGATGFIGSWLMQELLSYGISTTVIVRNTARLLPDCVSNPGLHVIEGSIEGIKTEDVKDSDFDAFFHLGWGGVAPENKNDINLQLNNISMSMAALELAHNLNCKKFIASGTVAEYVLCKDVMDVYEKQTPNDIYGAAKVSAHYFLEVRARQLEQPFIWMVIPSTFGARRTDNNIITYTIRTLLAGQKPSYGNLAQMWDFLYVGEVVRAMRLIGEKGVAGKIYGIGSGQYKPLRVYIEEIRDIINPKLPLGIGERLTLSNQTFSSCVNIYDLIADTGFTPQISFKEGIIMTICAFNSGGGYYAYVKLKFLFTSTMFRAQKVGA